MSVLNRIVPGKVVNNGINDKSIPDYVTVRPTYPLHLPVISLITPKGQLASEKGTLWLDSADIIKTLGNFLDTKSPYYNPTALLIKQLIEGGQASMGLRRLSANNRKARVALSAFVQKVTVPDYERDLAGEFVRDENGDPIPTGLTYEGLSIIVREDPEAAGKEPGELVRRVIPGVPAAGLEPEIPDTHVYPLYEAIAGVGDEYNRSGMVFGVTDSTMNYREVADFVKASGIYPFELKMFTEEEDGSVRFAKTVRNTQAAAVTLFKSEINSTQYSIKAGFGMFTGTNVNRPVTPVPAPFNDVVVYEDSITALCQAMYAVEKPHNDSLVQVDDFPYRQMNPFGCKNHFGAPYYAIVRGDHTVWDMTYSLKAKGGISPFLTNEGLLPDYVTPIEVDDPFNVLADMEHPISMAQGWEINNRLVKEDLQDYVTSNETKNYTKNRQSMWWDVGYAQDVKNVAIELLGQRKDVIVVPCSTVWVPGKTNSLSSIYSRSIQLTNALRMYPESEKWGTQTCRAAINLIEAKLTDEVLGENLSGNLDLAYAFALFAGNKDGVIRAAFSPDSGDNRILRTMHSPNIEFEEDFTASDNFANGAITLRPLDVEQLFRPALITVYKNADSVLKDLVTVFLCVCIEKIAQDEWNYVCGDTTISAANYVALFKDGAERKCRDRLGGLVRQITFEPSFSEGTPGSKAVMNTIAHAYFNKGKYMMNLDLFAYNEESLANG